jgi:non-specific serine/threonine protein kinase
MAGALLWFWWSRTHLREGRDWLTRSLALDGGTAPMRARALEAAGLLHASIGEQGAGIRLLEEAVALRRLEGEERGLTTSLSWLGNALFWSDPDRSWAVHNEALTLRRASGDERGIFVSLVGLAVTSLARDDVAEAARLLEEAVGTTQPGGDGYGPAFGHVYLAWTAIVQGNFARAAASLRAGLPSAQADRRVSHVFLTAGVLAWKNGRPQDAVRLLAAADGAQERAGRTMVPGTTYASLRAEQLRELRDGLDQDAFGAAWAEGQALSFDAAFALVRAILDAVPD